MWDFFSLGRSAHPNPMSAPSFCLVVDASCDLPAAVLQHPQLRMLPVRVVVGAKEIIDRREPEVIKQFYRESLNSPQASGGHSEPMTVDEMVAAFGREIALQFDEGLGVFVAASRSAIYSRAKQAVARARISSYTPRLHAGKIEPLQVDCVDSQAFFAGYAAQVMDLMDLVQQGAGIHSIMERQRFTVGQTYAYMAPGDVAYILHRASLKGEKSVSGLAAFAAKQLSITPIIRGHCGETAPVARKFGRAKAQQALFTMAQNMMQQKLLLSRHICFSYSGALPDITEQPGYSALLKHAKEHQVQVHLAPMSVTGSVNVGPDALVLGVVANDHTMDALL
jgi:fatty acid-binding protein DegV